jgi:tetratricopeptide (TPR) repeat protein
MFFPACLQVEEEERLWTEVIDTYGKLDAEWVSDIVSRAWGNRGNARSRQGRMEEALGDFDHSIELAPWICCRPSFESGCGVGEPWTL